MRVNCWIQILITFAVACAPRRPLPPTAVDVVMQDGPTAGSYSVVSFDVACTRGIVGEGSWGVQFSDWKGRRQGLRSLQLVVPAAVDTGSSSEFYLGLVFGTFSDGATYEIDTRPGAARAGGSGSVRIGPADSGTALTIVGRTDDGNGVAAVVHCRITNNLAR